MGTETNILLFDYIYLGFTTFQVKQITLEI